MTKRRFLFRFGLGEVESHRCLFLLGLGLATTIGVTWTLSVVIAFPDGAADGPLYYGLTEESHPCWWVGVDERSRTGRRIAAVSIRSEEKLQWVLENVIKSEERTPADPPLWTHLNRPPNAADLTIDGTQLPEIVRMGVARGWPCLALAFGGDAAFEGDGVAPPFQFRSGVHMGSFPWSDGFFEERMIPMRPVFPGLIADTLFYSGLWFILLWGVRQTRGRHRVRRGRCPSCGYSMRGLERQVCPECGWGREGAVR